MATNAINSLSYGGNTYPFTLPYGVCSTAAATAAKVVTVDNFSLETGAVVIVKFTNANSVANPTLNVNSTGAKTIVRYGTTTANTGTTTSGWTAGAVQLFVYDGTYWVRDYWYNTTYSLSGLGGVGSVSASGTDPLILSASKSGTGVTITGSLNKPYSKAWWNGGVVTVGTDGVVEVGKYIDFHAFKDTEDDFNYRLTAGDKTLSGNGSFSTATSITAGTSLTSGGALVVGTYASVGSYITMSNSNPYVKFVDTSNSNATYYVQGYEGKLAFGPTFANAIQMDLNGNLTMKASSTLTPRTNNTGTIGTSAMKWNAMYATTFYGALSGNATTATTAQYLASNSRMEYGWNGLNYFNISGTAGTAVKANNTPTTAWWHILRFNHANSAGYYTDLAVPFNDTSLYYKRVANGALQNSGWVRVLDALNYTSYVYNKTTSDGRYVYLSGDTMTGKLQLGASAQSGMTQAVGIHVHDLRSTTLTANTFGDQSVNFVFHNTLGDSTWRSAIHVKGWTGSYAAWQLSGNAHTSVSNKLYYREGVDSTWGSWLSIPFENRANTFSAANSFSGTVTIQNSTIGGSISFKATKSTDGKPTGILNYYSQGSSSATDYNLGAFYFTQYSYTDGTFTRLEYYDRYKLPTVAAGKTANATYDILTTKNTITTAQGGTGNTSYTANRLVWTETATKMTAGYHYANSSKVGINLTSEPSYNFYVNGTSAMANVLTFINATATNQKITTSSGAFYLSPASTLYLNSGSSSSLIFCPQGTEKARFDTSGIFQIKTTLTLNNNNITGVGSLDFADPGVQEGITWTGGNGWWIYESPDDLTNASGNLQFVHGSTRRLTINKDGYVDINARLVVRGNGNSYNEGIRILPASNGWSNVFFSANTTTLSDTHDGGWLIGRRGAAGSTCGAIGDFTIEEQNSVGANLTIHKNSGGATLQGSFKVKGHVQPTVTNSYQLGTTALAWKSAYMNNLYIRDATNSYTGGRFYTADSADTTAQSTILTIGNSTASGTAGNRYGVLRIYSTGADYAQLQYNDVGSYGRLRLTNAKGNYYGLLLGAATSGMAVMSIDGSHQGLYQQSNSKWIIYHNGAGAICIGGSSVVSNYPIVLNGTVKSVGNLWTTGTIWGQSIYPNSHGSGSCGSNTSRWTNIYARDVVYTGALILGKSADDYTDYTGYGTGEPTSVSAVKGRVYFKIIS